MFDCTLRRESIYQYNNTRKNVNLFFSSNSRILTDHVYFFNYYKIERKKEKKKRVWSTAPHTRENIFFHKIVHRSESRKLQRGNCYNARQLLILFSYPLYIYPFPRKTQEVEKPWECSIHHKYYDHRGGWISMATSITKL